MLLKYNNIEDVLDNFFKAEPYSFRPNTSNHKIEHDENGATLIMNVPGYNKKLIDVSVDGDLLVVEGKSNSGNPDGFTRKFSLGDTYDTDGIEASVVDGVLTLSIPYLEEVKPKRVKVKVS